MNIAGAGRGGRPRVLVVSARDYEPGLFRGGQVECEDVVCAVDEVDLLRLVAPPPADGFVRRKATRLALRLGCRVEAVPRPRRVKLTRDYPLMFVYVQNSNDLVKLKAVSGWRRRCALKVCFIEELWLRDLKLWGPIGFELLRDFDMIAVNFHETWRGLPEFTRLRCEWVPGGIDTLRFCPGPHATERRIDLYSMGRRSPETHATFLQLAQDWGWFYLHDTVEPKGVLGGAHSCHRDQLANLVRRTRYFVANMARVDWDTGQRELGYRSYEGAAGGAVLIGAPPDDVGQKVLFDWPDAHVRIPYGATSEAVEVLRELESDPERVARIRRDNVVNSLRRHDWAHRWLHILALVDMAPHERLRQRLRCLEARASQMMEPVSRYADSMHAKILLSDV